MSWCNMPGNYNLLLSGRRGHFRYVYLKGSSVSRMHSVQRISHETEKYTVLKILPSLPQAGVEHPKWGTPGVCNFIDARTQWIDQAVQQAVRDGVRQVRKAIDGHPYFLKWNDCYKSVLGQIMVVPSAGLFETLQIKK